MARAPGQLLLLVAALLAVARVASGQAVNNTNYSPCLKAQTNRAVKFRPLVRGVGKSSDWKSVLALDGGDVRAVIETAVLCEVEQALKRSLLFKGHVNFSSTDDFDILLGDYFDFTVGASAGTYVSTYLATEGGDAHMAIPSITALPGSALGAYQFMQAFRYLIRDATNTLPAGSARADAYQTLPLMRQVSTKFLKDVYGNRTLWDYYGEGRTALMAQWTRASGNGFGTQPYTVFQDNWSERGGIETTEVDGTPAYNTALNFYIWQMTAGATSWPQRVTPLIATTSPSSVQQATYPIMDSVLSATDPAEIVIPYMINRRRISPDRIAMLSIGTASVLNSTVGGDTFPINDVNWITSPALSSGAAWFATLGNRHYGATRVSSLFPSEAVLRLDQLITTSTAAGDVCPRGWYTPGNCTYARQAYQGTNGNFYPAYTMMGATVAQIYYSQIDVWVRNHLTK